MRPGAGPRALATSVSVVPPESPIRRFSATIAATAAAIKPFSGACLVSRKPSGSSPAKFVRIAPPCVLRRTDRPSNTAKSRRMVVPDTPSWSLRSATSTVPWADSAAMIASWRTSGLMNDNLLPPARSQGSRGGPLEVCTWGAGVDDAFTRHGVEHVQGGRLESKFDILADS